MIKSKIVFLPCIAFLSMPTAQGMTWPTLRHDVARSGAAEGQGEILIPAVQSRLSAGTTTQSRFFTHQDIDGDGRQEIFVVDAGRVAARDLDDRLFWNSDNLAIGYIHGLYDFDGDGADELLALGSQGLLILDPQNGDILWHKTDFAPNNNTTHDRNTLVGDVDGDGLPDIIMKAEWISDKSLHKYAFADGFFTDNPDLNEDWSYALCDSCFKGGIFPVVGDLDGDNALEVLIHGWKNIEVVEASTGTLENLYLETPFIQFLGPSQVVQMDDDPQLEVIHVARGDGDSAGISVVDALKFPDTLAAYDYFDPNDYRLRASVEFSGDLDDDGYPELAVSRFGDGQWTTLIYEYSEDDEAESAELALVEILENRYLRALVDVDGDGRKALLVEYTGQDQSGLSRFPRSELLQFNAPDDTESLWGLEGAELQLEWVPNGLTANGIFSSPPASGFDVDRDGERELLFQQDVDGDLRADRLIAVGADGIVKKSRDYDSGEVLSILESSGAITAPDAGAELLVLVDGRIRILNEEFQLLPFSVAAGAYEPETVVADLQGDGRPELVFRSSSGKVLVYEGQRLFEGLDLPTPEWSYTGYDYQSPLFLGPDEEGAYLTAFAYTRVAGQTTFEVFDAEGNAQGGVVIGEDLANNLLAADFTGDGFPDILGMYQSGVDEYSSVVINGATLQIEWSALNPLPTTKPTADRTVAVDVDGDEVSDICMGLAPHFACMSGVDGETLWSATTDMHRGAAMAGFVDEDPEIDLILLNQSTIQSRTPDLQLDWQVSEGEAAGDEWFSPTFVHKGALADIDDDGLAEIFATTTDNRVYSFKGDGSQRFRKVLKGGEISESDGDVDSTLSLERSVLGDVDGDGQMEVLIGSSDGYLYCLGAEDGHLQWSLAFVDRVRHTIIADVDGDQKLEIIATVGDGFIYFIDQATLDASASVRDVAVLPTGEADADGADIDEAESHLGLAGAWEPVEGATGYRVAILNENDALVVPWVDVGDVLSAVLTEGNFVLGQVYRFSVQAYDDQGIRGIESLSDGVEIVDISPPQIDGLQCEPNLFNPERDIALISAKLSDKTALASYRLFISDGESESQMDDGQVGLFELDYTFEWNGQVGGFFVQDGDYDFRLSVEDQKGHVVEDEVRCTIDTIPPAAPVILSPEDAEIRLVGPLIATGEAEALSRIHLDLVDFEACETTTDEEGAWSCAFEGVLEAGSYELVAEAVDGAGNISEETSVVFEVVEPTPTPTATPIPETPSAAPTASPTPLGPTDSPSPSEGEDTGTPTGVMPSPTIPSPTTPSPSASEVATQSPSAEPTASTEPTASEQSETLAPTPTVETTPSAEPTVPVTASQEPTPWVNTPTAHPTTPPEKTEVAETEPEDSIPEESPTEGGGGGGCECNSGEGANPSALLLGSLLLFWARRRQRGL